MQYQDGQTIMPVQPLPPPTAPRAAIPAAVEWDQLEQRITELSSRDGEVATILDLIRRILQSTVPRGTVSIGSDEGVEVAHLARQLDQLAAAHQLAACRLASAGTAAEDGRVMDISRSKVPSPFLGMTLAELERRAIIAALASNDGNKAKTARALGISLRSIYNKMRRHGLTMNKELRDQHREWESHLTS